MNGAYPATLDSQCRVVLPADFVEPFREGGAAMLTPNLRRASIYVEPVALWDARVSQLEEKGKAGDDTSYDLHEAYAFLSQKAKLQGSPAGRAPRLTIPPEMRKRAALGETGSTVYFVGMGSRLELLSEAEYARTRQEVQENNKGRRL